MFQSAFGEDVATVEVGPGVTLQRLWRHGPQATAPRAVVLDFAPGSSWPGVDVHQPGPEEVYVVSGRFLGLAGPGSDHQAGDFVHCEIGSEHAPSSQTGGRLFVFYPQG
jgi:quercetin dioxygenase-like cupin family protein